MKDRLLRPALVAVSKKPDNSEKKDKIVTITIATVPRTIVNLKFKTVAEIITGPNMKTAKGLDNPPVK